MNHSLLVIKNLNSYYEKCHVLQDITLEVGYLKRVVVLGRNGMGKTTLLRSILGIEGVKREGSIMFENEEVIMKQTYEIAKKGIGYVPQGWKLFSSLSVDEHLSIAYREVYNERRTIWNPENVLEMFPELKIRRRIGGTKLSGGEQQLLAIARALVTNPILLMMDEPSEGLSLSIISRIIEICNSLAEKGVSLLLIEQNLEMAKEVAEIVYIMVNGRIVYKADVEKFKNDRENQHNLLGV